jgi:hypothetical protein
VAVLIKFSYNKPGLLIREIKTYKPLANRNVKNETREFSYNSVGSISQVLIKGRDSSNKAYQLREEYTYNEKKLLAAVNSYSDQNSPKTERSWKYLDSGVLSIYQESAENGKLVLLLQYDYKKHFMDQGTQISYFAGKE